MRLKYKLLSKEMKSHMSEVPYDSKIAVWYMIYSVVGKTSILLLELLADFNATQNLYMANNQEDLQVASLDHDFLLRNNGGNLRLTGYSDAYQASDKD